MNKQKQLKLKKHPSKYYNVNQIYAKRWRCHHFRTLIESFSSFFQFYLMICNICGLIIY